MRPNVKIDVRLAILMLPMVLGACTSGASFLQDMEPQAVAEAQRRGAFEMNCPAATTTLLSSEMMPPIVRAVRLAASGPERAVYNVGVSGCGKRTTYVVICPENGSNACFDGGSRTEVQED